MSTNTIGSIAIETAQVHKARFNWSHKVSTTCNFGDVKPIMAKLMIPGSSATVSNSSILRMAPLAKPVVGSAEARIFHQFVGFSELLQNFPHMMAQLPVARGDNLFEVESLPHISLGLLSYLTLIGAKCTVWVETEANSNEFYTPIIKSLSSDVAAGQLWNALFGAPDSYDQTFKIDVHSTEFPHFVGTCLWLHRIFGTRYGTDAQTGLNIPISNFADSVYPWRTFFDFQAAPGTLPSAANPWVDSRAIQTFGYVDLNAPDCCLDLTRNGKRIKLAFRFSDFGKRINDCLIGNGYVIDYQSKTQVSLMPLFATWYAYYHQHGLILNNNYYSSSLYRLLGYLDYHNVTDLNQYFTRSEFINFINDLGNLWMTRQQDYTSAHIRSTAIAPALGLSDTFIDVDGDANIEEVENWNIYGGEVQVNGHSLIDGIKHGHLDSEYLKRLYQCTNIKTVLGRDVAATLRAEGEGNFVDNCKNHFIGSDRIPIDFSIVVSNSDTFKDDAGSSLGDYAGFGLGSNDGRKKFSYDTEEYGYWITSVTVVPDSSSVQALDPSLLAIDKNHLYQPKYDALGYEATIKSCVVGQLTQCDPNEQNDENTLSATFGYVPRYTGLKICNSIASGGFSQNSVKKAFRPYSLERFIDIGDKQLLPKDSHVMVVPGASQASETHSYVVSNLLTPARLPIASTVWRYYTRYAFLGDYLRIFQAQGINFTNESEFFDTLVADDELRSRFEYLVRIPDNIMLHTSFEMLAYCPMKPIELSFETVEDGHQANMSHEKA